MDIRNRKGLRQEAAAALAENPGDPRKTLLVFIAVTALGSNTYKRDALMLQK